MELSESGSESDGDDDVAGSTRELDSVEDSEVLDPEEEDLEEGEEEEEKDMDNFIDASGLEPNAKNDIRGWKELRDQIKSDMDEGHKRHDTRTRMNKLLLVRNFTTLRIKGIQRIAASEQIALQFHEGAGIHFARRIRFLARHYQLFEQLPKEKRGAAGGRSLLKDEQVQTAARAHLSSVPTGEVTPRQFHKALNDRILPTLGLAVKHGLSERTARRWLLALGWRRTRVKKGVYMDGHERPDIVKY